MGIFDSVFGDKGSEQQKQVVSAPSGVSYGQKKALALYKQGPTYTGLGATSNNALGQISAIAGQPNPFLKAGSAAVNGIASGRNRINTGGMFQGVYDGADDGMFGQVASGGMVGSNPYREAAIQAAMDDTANRLKTSMGSSGIGAASFGRGMSEGVGRVGTDARMAGYDADMAAMLGARQAQMGTQLSAAQGLTGVEGMNINNQLQATGMMPGLDQMRYAGADRLLGVGAAQDADRQNRANAGWDNLGRYMGMFSGFPGSTTTSSAPGQSPLFSAMGGAMAGSQIGGMFGSPLIGAGIGGLAGMFG